MKLPSSVVAAALALVPVVFTAASAQPTRTPSAAMLAPVQRWIDAYNAAQTLPDDIFTDDVVITDEFPPYAWSGKVGARAWGARIEQSFQKRRATHEHVVTGTPQAFMTSQAGDRASFVLPATLTYDVEGKTQTDRALWLFVVVKGSDNSWKIAADTWTQNNNQ